MSSLHTYPTLVMIYRHLLECDRATDDPRLTACNASGRVVSMMSSLQLKSLRSDSYQFCHK